MSDARYREQRMRPQPSMPGTSRKKSNAPAVGTTGAIPSAAGGNQFSNVTGDY
jgi:hypothetical protein